MCEISCGPEHVSPVGNQQDVHASLLRRELDRVRQVIVEHLLEARRVDRDDPQGRVHLDRQPDSLLRRQPAQDVANLADDLAQIYFHHASIVVTANTGVSWSTPTLNEAALATTSYTLYRIALPVLAPVSNLRPGEREPARRPNTC